MAEAEGFEALFLLLSITEYTGVSVAGVWGTGRKVRGNVNLKPLLHTLSHLFLHIAAHS